MLKETKREFESFVVTLCLFITSNHTRIALETSEIRIIKTVLKEILHQGNPRIDIG